MRGIVVEETPLPARLGDDAASDDFRASVEVRNVCEEAGYGSPDVRVSPERLLAAWNDPYAPHRHFLVRVDGRVVGRAMHERALDDGTGACWLDVRVLPEHRGCGIGRALAEHVERVAREEGGTHAIVYAASPEGPGPRLDAASGVGSIPADNPEARFLLRRGYRLEQVVRASRLPLPVDDDRLRAQLHAARRRTGASYRVHRWEGVTPARFRDDLAVLLTRMSTDAPQAGLGEPEDVWTAERVAEREGATVAGGLQLLTAAAEDASDGRLVAFTQLGVPGDPGQPVEQEDTLVLREHRGNRLGMLVKLENLDQLRQRHPGHPSVLTWNAGENRHMLAVNEAIGFAPMAHEGAWRLEL